MHDAEEQRREKYGEEGTVFSSLRITKPRYTSSSATGPASPTYRNMDRVEEGPVAAAVESAMV